MKIIFSDINKDVANALRMAFTGAGDVEVYSDSIFNHKADAIISPANSFGYMDGGIDLEYSKYFGWDLQVRLQRQITENFHGELLVGQATIIETNNTEIPYLISAPTMRVPMHISGSVNVYLAFRAALQAVKSFNDWGDDNILIRSILSPGLGTYVGNMQSDVAASQMLIAYKEVKGDIKINYGGIRAAHHHHSLIARGNLSF